MHNMNSNRTDIFKGEKNVVFLAAISNLLEPETVKTLPMSKFITSMAPDTAEWSRRISCLKYWRAELLKNGRHNSREKFEVDKSIKQANFQHRKTYKRHKRILLMGSF